eukprot:CCRYP_000468-RC/>CCRYP_000468-RC protein AED:0.16 eAED:0.16 QI:0/0.71/0.37/1/0.85/0.75/8/25/1511
MSRREVLVNFVSPSSPFDNFILLAIFINSIAIACVDYQHIDEHYQPSTVLSLRNRMIEKAELVFTAIFTVECILKCVAHGFWRGEKAYVRDGWNVLDLFIVIVSILGLLPNAPNFSVLRSFRVMRPLRSISKLPSLRKIIGAFIDSIGDLANVMLLLVLLLICFALFGVTFWRGRFHSRCRLTPFPVKMPMKCRSVSEACWDDFIIDAIINPEEHRCLPIPNDSPMWSTGFQDCIWPIDSEDRRACSRDGHGQHSCIKPAAIMTRNVSRTCGSNYNLFGPRFIESREPYGYPRMMDDVFYQDFDWGFTNFDNFSSAFMTTFQILTMEGWSDIMYRTMDAWSAGPTVIAYAALIVVGSQLVINIMLAVITGSLEHIESSSKELTNEEPRDLAYSYKKQRAQAPNSLITSRIQCMVANKIYGNFIMFVIAMNTVVLSCDHYGITPSFQKILEAGNFFTTVVFFLDMVLQNISFGVDVYWSNTSTLFDGLIALASVAELVVARTAASAKYGKSVMSVFRSLRLVRLFKMVQRWKSLHSLLNTIGRAAADVRSFAVLLFLFVFIYALVGMQLFANRLHFDGRTGAHIDIDDSRYVTSTIPRRNFDNLFTAVTTVFQVLSGENWNVVLYDCWKATYWIAPVYFLSLVVFGIFIVLNLFLAILLKQFDNIDVISRSQKRLLPETNPEKGKTTAVLSTTLSQITKWKDSVLRLISSMTQRSPQYCELQSRCTSYITDKRLEVALTVVIVMSSAILALDNPLSDPTTSYAEALEILNYLFTAIFIVEFLVKIVAYGPLTYLLDPWNFLDVSAAIASVLEILNIGAGRSFRVLRTLRVLRPLKVINRFPELKLVVDALLSSLPSVANVGLICAVFFLTFAIFGVTFLKGTFYQCNESYLSPEQLQLVTYPVPFGELGVDQVSWLDFDFSGCDAKKWDADHTPTSKDICFCLRSEWVPTIPQNFNNVLRGVALLFEISTTEGWADVMHAAVDQRGVDMQPVTGNNEFWALYFILFLVLGAFFILELFVGVIIENFARIKEVKGCGLMTAAQKEWALTQAFVMKIKPERRFSRPSCKPRALCYDLIMTHVNPWFDRVIICVIILNCACIATASFGDSAEKTRFLELCNEVCSFIFVLEAVFKIIALGERYFCDGWNKFDFSIVLGLIIGQVLKRIINNDQLAASVSSVIGIMRIGRIIRLIRLVKSLRTIVNSIVTAIPGIFNIGGLILLLFFVYAVIGMQLYGTIAFQGALNEQANFRSIGNAMLLLFRFSTGENWNSFMWNLLEERTQCDPDPIYDKRAPWCLEEDDYPRCTEVNGCSGGMSVFAYFYSFIFIVGLVVFNMFVGVVLEAFENSQESEVLNPSDLDHFVSVWQEYDPEATYYINASDVQSFLSKLRPPLGLFHDQDRTFARDDLYLKDQTLLDIPVNEKKQVNIVNVATQVAKRFVKTKQGENFVELSSNHPIHRRAMKQREGMKMTLGDVYMNDARIILKAVRRFRQSLARRRANQATIHPESSFDGTPL